MVLLALMTSENIWLNLSEVRVGNIAEELTGLRFSSLVLKRNSYINKVYELETADSKERVIVKFYRTGRWSEAMIRSEHHVLFHLAELDIPVVTPRLFGKETLFFHKDIPVAFFPKYGGRAVDEFSDDQWEQVGRIIGRIHLALGSLKDIQRDVWLPSVVTRSHLDRLQAAELIPPTLEGDVIRAIDGFIEFSDPLIRRLTLFPIHGDCHRGNMIFRPDEGLRLIDFDDMVIGPAIQDVWMLLPDEWEACERELALLRQGYELFRPFPKEELAAIPLLQCMRRIHFAAWCAAQVAEPHFEDFFSHLTEDKYWYDTLRMIRLTMTNSQGATPLKKPHSRAGI